MIARGLPRTWAIRYNYRAMFSFWRKFRAGSKASEQPASPSAAASAPAMVAPAHILPSHAITLRSGEHSIRPDRLDRGVVTILRQLAEAGHESYLVGGAVRDLMLGKSPKDYDIGTAATPQQVMKLFRRSRVIGRRFPIVHVRMGPKVYEVTTFRALGEDVFGEVRVGTAREDALRRDITVNGLLYDVGRDEVIDWVGGAQDLKARRICVIGDATTRFTEDPVRILRSYRMATRLGFELDASIEPAARYCAEALGQVSRSRLTLEKEKDFLGELRGSAIRGYRDAAYGKYVDAGLHAVLQHTTDSQLALYDRLGAAVRAQSWLDDRDGIMRAMLLAVLVLPEVYWRGPRKATVPMQRVEQDLEPLFLGLELARWKRPVVARAVFGLIEVDRQVHEGSLNARHLGKDFYGYALRLSWLLRHAGVCDVSAESREAQRGQLEAQMDRHDAHRRRRSEASPEHGSDSEAGHAPQDRDVQTRPESDDAPAKPGRGRKRRGGRRRRGSRARSGAAEAVAAG